MNKCLMILIGSIMLIGCQHNESNNEGSPLVGSWLTDACDQMIGSTGELMDIWGKSIFQFYTNGSVVPQIKEYSDSSCTGNYELIDQFNDANTPFSFQDLGEEILQEGVTGGRITFSIVVDEEKHDTEGFFHINGSALCFSDNINFEPFGISSSSSESQAIDYEKCLSRIN